MHRGTTIDMWVAIGAGVGAAFGAATDSRGLWLAIGVAVGAAFGAALSNRRSTDAEKGPAMKTEADWEDITRLS